MTCPLSSKAVPDLAEFSLVPRMPSFAFIPHYLLQFLFFLKPSFLRIYAQLKTKRNKEKETEENEQKDQGFSNLITPTVACTWGLALYRQQEAPTLPSEELKERVGLESLRPEKSRLKGMPAAIIKWSASVWMLTTQLLASYSNAWLWQEATR